MSVLARIAATTTPPPPIGYWHLEPVRWGAFQPIKSRYAVPYACPECGRVCELDEVLRGLLTADAYAVTTGLRLLRATRCPRCHEVSLDDASGDPVRAQWLECDGCLEAPAAGATPQDARATLIATGGCTDGTIDYCESCTRTRGLRAAFYPSPVPS